MLIRPDVRSGSIPEVAALERHVRSTPRSRHRQAVRACPKSAMNRLMRRSKAKPLLDVYRNFIRDDRRVERVVLGVAQHELKGMLTGRKFDARLGLARSKMEM
jgi:hypothetical protein